MTETPHTLRSFGRRKGRKLRPNAQDLYTDLLPTLKVGEWASDAKNVTIPDPLWLEIGFGGGEHLAHIATSYPDIQMIGCEPYVNGIAGLLSQIDEQDIQNIRIYNDDVRELLGVMPEACLSRAYILYPDPWPKLRHHKRRLIQKPLLDALARVLKSGTELRIATDWADYTTWILERLLPHESFTWTATQASDWQQPWDNWIPTKYEQKAKREGRDSSYLIFVRK